MTATRYTAPARQVLAQCRDALEGCRMLIDCGAVWVPGSDEFLLSPEQMAEFERRRQAPEGTQ